MTAKVKKTKRRKARSRHGKVIELQASVEDDLLLLGEEGGAEARWNHPPKRKISLRVDTEVVDWFKSKGPGYQTRIKRKLRRVMMEHKKRSRRHARRPPAPEQYRYDYLKHASA
ncbi:MAG TPA: BrnA antitoxin family protein [Candidatus Sulfotelmatobacter sp.]|nr:BrnA antitoxin family protein [Candidatus Sulfotelmatobacter sp.]